MHLSLFYLSFTSQSTAIGIPAASVIDAPTAAVLRQIPNLGSSLDAPIQLNIQSEDKPTRCLVLKNVFDPDPSQKVIFLFSLQYWHL